MNLEINKTFDARECPSCGCEIPANNNRCPICNYEFPVPSRIQKSLRIGGAIIMLALLTLFFVRC